jgi:ADP-L-glycero-D-manno-heptose 6-epimerase
MRPILIHNNFEFTKILSHWAVASKARFLYASSAATYGDGAMGMSDTDLNLDKLRPLNTYGFSKHLFDRYAWRNGLLDKIVGLKYFNVFGPNEDHKGDMRSMVIKLRHNSKKRARFGCSRAIVRSTGTGNSGETSSM